MVITSSLHPSLCRVINRYKTFIISTTGNFITPMSINKRSAARGAQRNSNVQRRRKRKENKQNKNKREVPAGRHAGRSPQNTHTRSGHTITLKYK